MARRRLNYRRLVKTEIMQLVLTYKPLVADQVRKSRSLSGPVGELIVPIPLSRLADTMEVLMEAAASDERHLLLQRVKNVLTLHKERSP